MFLSTFHVYLTYLIFDSLFVDGNVSVENRGKPIKGDIDWFGDFKSFL